MVLFVADGEEDLSEQFLFALLTLFFFFFLGVEKLIVFVCSNGIAIFAVRADRHQLLDKGRIVYLVQLLVPVDNVETVVSKADLQVDCLWVVLVGPIILIKAETEVLCRERHPSVLVRIVHKIKVEVLQMELESDVCHVCPLF